MIFVKVILLILYLSLPFSLFWFTTNSFWFVPFVLWIVIIALNALVERAREVNP